MDYAAFQALAANYDTTSVTLSPDSMALVLCLVQLANNRAFWSNSDGTGVDDTQWDEIEALVGNCTGELSP